MQNFSPIVTRTLYLHIITICHHLSPNVTIYHHFVTIYHQFVTIYHHFVTIYHHFVTIYHLSTFIIIYHKIVTISVCHYLLQI